MRASADSERVRVYCERHGLDPSATKMAVVVQRMFPSAVSGVMFGADPTDPEAGTILISAGFGLGEGVVSGHADADEIRVVGAEVETKLTDKQRMMVRGVGGGTELVDVPAEQRGTSCLTDAQALELSEIARRLELEFGVPQDVEWAYSKGGELAILQTRPLTGVGPRTGRLYTWDNSNIVESYSGVTSPLTYTFARSAYEVVYRQFCEVMGVPKADITAHAPVFKAMIGLIRGRVYYRLDNWYQVLQLLPGAKYNKRFMEQMMGVRKQADLGGPGGGAGKFRILYLVWRMLRALGGLGRRTVAFKALFAEAYGRYHGRDLDAVAAPDLVEAYRELERDVLLNWKAPIINDFYAMIFFGVLKKMAPDHHNDLLCGEPGMESTLPTREVMKMALQIRENAELKTLFEGSTDAEVIAAMAAGHPVLAPLNTWLVRYLDLYGDRCMEELKLETPTLRDDPTFVIATLRNYVARPDLTIAGLEKREREVRQAAEAAVTIPFGKRMLFRWILRRARRHVRERENLRFARTRVFGLVRQIFRSLGGHLVRGGLLDRVDDVFYLGVEEVFGLIEGTTVTVDVRPVVKARRAEFGRYRALPAPSDRFETRGGVHLGNVFVDTDPAPPAEGDVLTGLGCAPGVVRDRVRVIHSPKDDLSVNGQIMVCERTDPGWVPLFPTAGGLLVERGSALSHSAIVAREFGIPTVVGIPGLMDRIVDGQWVELDGKAGTVRLDVTGPEPDDEDAALG
ncbi:MAG: phosphohistidine swiveling domain-containing protein [Myxococcota bacterium]